MPNVEINLTGPSYVHAARSQSSQRTVGLYPELLDTQSGKSKFILRGFPGLKLFGTASGKDRGMLEHKGVLYKVTGTTLYSVDFAGTHTSLGTIEGTGRCILEGIGDNVVIVSGGRAWQLASSTVTEITDVDLETPNSCAHLNNQMIYDGDGGRFGVSDVGDATSIDGLNYATAESNADNLLRVYTFNQILYLLGEKTIEAWYNSGVGSPPFDRMEGAIMPVGLAAIYSVSHNDNFMYFLGDDNKVYRVTGSQKENISTIALTHAIKDYLVVDDAIGYCFSFENQNFYMLIFPSANKSWCYTESSGQWFEPNENRYIGNSFAHAYRKNLIADYDNGNIYELDLDTYDENGSLVERYRDSGAIDGSLLRSPGKWIEFNRFELIMETGVGRTITQGINDYKYNGKSLSVSSQETQPADLAFSSDDLDCYIVGGNAAVYQYTLTTAKDVSTGSYASKSLDVSTQETLPEALAFSSDDLACYIAGVFNQTIYQYTLTTAKDVSTGSYASKSLDVSAQGTPVGLAFSSDDSICYMLAGSATSTIFQYALTTAKDVSTGSYTGKFLDVSAQEANPQGLFVCPSGRTCYVVGNGGIIYEYRLSIPKDISTGVYAGKYLSVSLQESSPAGLALNSNGGLDAYIVGPASDTIYQYTFAQKDNRDNPYVMLSVSYDGGKTYGTEMWAQAGKQGDYIYKVEWHSLAGGYDLRVRVKVSDPNQWAFLSASADLEVGI